MMIPTTAAAQQIPVGLVSPGAVIPTGLHALETARKVAGMGSFLWWGQDTTGDPQADFAAWRMSHPDADPVRTLDTCDSAKWYAVSPCWDIPRDEWSKIRNVASVATARPPTQPELTHAEATGQFNELVQKLSNEEMAAQQNLNKEFVQPVDAPPQALMPIINTGIALGQVPGWMWAAGAAGLLFVLYNGARH